MTPKSRVFLPVAVLWLALDLVTKRLALAHLQPGVPHELLGEAVRFTLTFNRGAAMGISLGEWSRPAFTVLSLVVMGVLAVLYRRTDAADRRQAAILGFVLAGAVGNLIDRLRWSRGVVDFVDLGIGSVRFWTFNVADMGITLGAIALAFVLGREEQAAKAKATPALPG
jgi:signal peptidase II